MGLLGHAYRIATSSILQRFATRSPDAKSAKNVRYQPNPTKPANQESTDYGYNYVSPNKLESGDSEANGDMYLKLDGTQNQQTNQYLSLSTKDDAIDDTTAELYDVINEPEQPQYEILPCEAGDMAQYLDVVADHNKDDEDTSEMPYLDVLPATNEEIYSDISDTQTKPEDDQELEIYD